MATETRTDVRAANTQTQAREPRGVGQPMGRPEPQPVGRQEPEHVRMMSRGDETKLSLKTTEFWIYLAAVAAVLIASYAVGTTDTHSDYFRADKAWFFIVLLTIGYLGSRGLAKAGSSITRSERR
jgi:hypothetical protein